MLAYGWIYTLHRERRKRKESSKREREREKKEIGGCQNEKESDSFSTRHQLDNMAKAAVEAALRRQAMQSKEDRQGKQDLTYLRNQDVLDITKERGRRERDVG